MELPVENKRVRQILEYFCRGNELQFSREIGVSQPRINRLFAKDSRNNRFPLVSFDIVKAILKRFEEVSPDWLVMGYGEMLRNPKETVISPSLYLPLDDYQHFYKMEEGQNLVSGDYIISRFKRFGVEFLVESKKSIYGCKEVSVYTFIIYGRQYVLYTEQGILIKILYPVEGQDDVLKCVGEYDETPFRIDKKSINKLAIVLGKLVNY